MHWVDPGSEGTVDSALVTAPTILLVEDEAFVREAACAVLSGAGYRVLKARDASGALQVFREHARVVELLLTDVVLPDRSGCDLALELATLRDGVKFIFVSGYSENSFTRKWPRHPDGLYLPKPFSMTSLMEKVQQACPRRILSAEPRN